MIFYFYSTYEICISKSPLVSYFGRSLTVLFRKGQPSVCIPHASFMLFSPPVPFSSGWQISSHSPRFTRKYGERRIIRKRQQLRDWDRTRRTRTISHILFLEKVKSKLLLSKKKSCPRNIWEDSIRADPRLAVNMANQQQSFFFQRPVCLSPRPPPRCRVP